MPEQLGAPRGRAGGATRGRCSGVAERDHNGRRATASGLFCDHLLDAGSDIRTMQEPLRHRDVSTMITHVLNRGRRGVRSPFDQPELAG